MSKTPSPRRSPDSALRACLSGCGVHVFHPTVYCYACMGDRRWSPIELLDTPDAANDDSREARNAQRAKVLAQ